MRVLNFIASAACGLVILFAGMSTLNTVLTSFGFTLHVGGSLLLSFVLFPISTLVAVSLQNASLEDGAPMWLMLVDTIVLLLPLLVLYAFVRDIYRVRKSGESAWRLFRYLSTYALIILALSLLNVLVGAVYKPVDLDEGFWDEVSRVPAPVVAGERHERVF